jgi:1-acyl-sn-glycerol-3-phosphate acyltransferase
MRWNRLSWVFVWLFSVYECEVKAVTFKDIDIATERHHHIMRQNRKSFSVHFTASSAVSTDGVSRVDKKDVFTINTKYGRLNPYGVYYIAALVFLGLPWFISLSACQMFYKITGDRVDKMRKLPMFLSQCWGEASMLLTGTRPTVIGKDKLAKFYRENRAAMFVSNHNSWLDITNVARVVGWRNYKLISKAELAKIPILGKGIRIGGHVMIDRSSRKSQLQTFKAGVKWLTDGVHLCAFPEGTRSKDGRLLPFKAGAYKMAIKAGSPIIPLSIIGAAKSHPPSYIFPRIPSSRVCKVIVHDPIETVGRSEEEIAKLVRKAVMSGLPDDQLPLED